MVVRWCKESSGCFNAVGVGFGDVWLGRLIGCVSCALMIEPRHGLGMTGARFTCRMSAH